MGVLSWAQVARSRTEVQEERRVKPFQERTLKLLIVAGFCELATCTEKLCRAVEVSVSPRAVLLRAAQQLPAAREQQGRPWELC